MNKPVRVFLVEDSPVASTILQRILASASEVEIVGIANDGISALKQIPQSKPDVVCTDLLMSKMDGWELIDRLMRQFPIPILVISEVITNDDTQKIAQLLEAGAIDVFPKPQTGFIKDYEKQKSKLIQKIIILSGVKVFARNKVASSVQFDNHDYPKKAAQKVNINYQIITIGVSTGGPKALQKIFSQLPADFPVPIVCTQHISVGFLSSLISWLSLDSSLKIKVAESGEKPTAGTIYFAPEQYHLTINHQERFCYDSSPLFDPYCPSITAMFQSFAQFYNQTMIGVLLTGMGKDGVAGMQEVYRRGGLNIAQDEASSVIFGMPFEAINLGIVQQVLSIDKIANFLLDTVTH